jgi:hydroxyacylglutathione hydrolase
MRCCRCLVVLMVVALGVLHAWPLRGAEAPGDQGPAAPADDKIAVCHVVNAYEYPGFKLIQFHLPVLAQYSYLLVSGGQALVVDPGREVGVYLDQAQKEGARITGVFLTHNHADFVAGHMELAKRANCPIFASADSGCTFRFQPLKEGSTIEVGEALVKILVTPGHTPEAVCGLVAAKANPTAPLLLLSGDTLWIGHLGRPDLVDGNTSAATLASQAYDTWTNKLRLLPEALAIFPGHGGGSLCGLRLSDEPTSTLGAEKKTNPDLAHQSRGEFITALLASRPEVPQSFQQLATLNKKGPPVVAWEKPPPPVKVLWKLPNPKQAYVVDLRSPRDYADGHIANSVNMGIKGSLEPWTRDLIPFDANLVLYGTPEEVQDAAIRLTRVGHSASEVTPETWEKAKGILVKSELIKPEDLKVRLEGNDSPVVVDVRPGNVCATPSLGKAVSMPVGRLSILAPGRLDPTQAVVTVGDSTYCASMAVGLLERLGFKRVGCMDGGLEDWTGAGLPVSEAETPPATQAAVEPPPQRAPRRGLRLPQRISPTDLKRTLLDLPGTFDLIDIRPPESFAAYKLPEAVNVDVAEVLQNPLYLKGTGPLILVDRDGSLAMAVGGVLSQKTWRAIKVLHGGMEAYKKEFESKPKPPVKVPPVPDNPGETPAAAGDKAPW